MHVLEHLLNLQKWISKGEIKSKNDAATRTGVNPSTLAALYNILVKCNRFSDDPTPFTNFVISHLQTGEETQDNKIVFNNFKITDLVPFVCSSWREFFLLIAGHVKRVKELSFPSFYASKQKDENDKPTKLDELSQYLRFLTNYQMITNGEVTPDFEPLNNLSKKEIKIKKGALKEIEKQSWVEWLGDLVESGDQPVNISNFSNWDHSSDVPMELDPTGKSLPSQTDRILEELEDIKSRLKILEQFKAPKIQVQEQVSLPAKVQKLDPQVKKSGKEHLNEPKKADLGFESVIKSPYQSHQKPIAKFHLASVEAPEVEEGILLNTFQKIQPWTVPEAWTLCQTETSRPGANLIHTSDRADISLKDLSKIISPDGLIIFSFFGKLGKEIFSQEMEAEINASR